MRALRKTAPGAGVVLAEVPGPDPAEHDVVVEPLSVGLCGSDLHIDEWVPEYEWMGDHLPVTLGHEVVAVVREVGHRDPA